MSLIYIIRHGETDANVNDKINDKNNKTPSFSVLIKSILFII